MGAALCIVSVEPRSERALMATKEWREAANAALAGKPRGTHARCAEHAGCTPGTLTQLLAGEIASSVFVGPVSDFLGIPRPQQVALDADELEAGELFRRADAGGRKLALELLRRIVPNNNGD